ncbi:MAG: hypothetical protein IIY57_04260 [Erysipelotrichaceae bacterium]|nr:hypothetical protein [Erysipelotrichaceae bacterium]
MLDRIINILQQAEVSDYRLMELTTVSHQAFFVRQKLDQHRISDTVHVTLDVYMDKETENGRFRGKASCEVHPNETDEQIRAKIEKLKFNALLAVNPYYQLVKDEKYREERVRHDLYGALKTVVDAMHGIQDTESEKINSYEVFVNEYYYHIVNSQGTDISFNTMDEQLEVVINSVNEGHEIELYHVIDFVDRTAEEITSEIMEVFRHARERNRAVPTRKMDNVRVLLSGDFIDSFFDYFLTRTNTQAVFLGYSSTKIGDNCQESDQCDRITLRAVAHLDKSSNNLPYSKDGNKAQDLTIIENGIYQNYWGDQISACYLGMEKVSPVYNFIVEPGSRSVEEMKQEPYLELIQFSDFMMDPIVGNFGGEIRLGYYFDGNTVVPVTGGSITCNMNAVLKHVYFSRETRQLNNCIVPATIEIFGVNVSGEE